MIYDLVTIAVAGLTLLIAGWLAVTYFLGG